MRPSVAGLVLATLVVLAGCSVIDRADTPLDDGTTPTAGWDGDPDNPYRKATLVVGLDNRGNASREFAPLVREALAYWEANAERYAGYPIDYELRPAAAEPDVLVTVVEAVDCGDEDHVAGCADVIEKPGQFDPPVSVRVADGFTDESTVAVLTHEFGHTLGLDHGDAPQSVMAAEGELTTLPRPDATARAMPWADPELAVYVDVSALPPDERDAARRQIDAALGYYADGAAGTVPDNVTFVRTDNRSAAEVTVVAAESLACQPDGGSCGSLSGSDPDRDGALETHARLEISFADLDTDAVAWHVGRWLGRGFGFDEAADYPPPLWENTTYTERRSEWWS